MKANEAADFLLDEAQRRDALRLARRTLELRLATGRTPERDDLLVPASPVFKEDRAVFVTLKRSGELRGCIGHILPVAPLWRSIRDNAISAALCDHRFPPVTREELATLRLEVSVLTPLCDITDLKAFEVGRHGILLTLGVCRAVFLPQVAPQQGWDKTTTLEQLALKAGLDRDGWRDADFQLFEAQVFKE